MTNSGVTKITRYLSIPCLLLVFAISGYSQKSKLKVDYNKIKNQTSIEQPLINGCSTIDYRLKLYPIFQFEGSIDEPIKIINFGIGLDTYGKSGKLLTGGKLFYVLADNNRFSVKIYADVIDGQGEHGYIILSKEEFSTVANASSVDMQVGDCEISLSAKKIIMFREIYDKAASLFPDKDKGK